jgi:serine/threonine protein kinase/tetratricopeptide (TPR) repeat protein
MLLGPFELEGPVARGGMAEVWSARHREQGVPVAVKVLTGPQARDPKFLVGFRNEARLVAGLDHPHVVTVFDFGTIAEPLERASRGRLVADSPYLVMEWASEGTLQSRAPSSWPELRSTLVTLLDALAHVHARDVVHRDIKPANVLRCGPSDLRPGLRLADFGVARGDRRVDEDSRAISGTYAYLAPEQISKAHDQGPWTDLYSFGCLTYKLLIGVTPFGGTTAEVLEGHVLKPVPQRSALFAAPPSLWPWMLRLLEKTPRARFQCAADAAFALSRLGSESSVEVSARFATDVAPESTDDLATVIGEQAPALVGTLETPLAIPTRDPAPPMPESYETATEHDGKNLQLLGVGLGLYGLRAIPLVNREQERRRLWDTLREVRERGRARLVFLEGPSGFGKSRLAEWCCERALTLGVASVLRATHTEGGAGLDGLGPMLSRHFRSERRAPSEVAERVERALLELGVSDEHEAQALCALISKEQRFDGSSRERHALVRRHLTRLGVDRPVIVWLDDLQWGDDALSFVGHLLEAQDRSPAPVLVLATLRSEALAERPIEAELVAQLAERLEVLRIRVGPLRSEHWLTLVGQLLGLESNAALKVEERAAGNPLFAIQLVGDWVDRKILVLTPRGLALREGTTVELPDDVHVFWARRIEALFADRTDDEARALELAAVLGQEVDAEEWTHACDLAKLAAPWALVEALLDARLAHASQDGAERRWAFVHGMVRESLQRRAAQHGRLTEHHRTCGSLLVGREGQRVSERLGRHLLAAGELERALRPLLEGADERRRAGDMRVALSLLSEREGLLRTLGVDESDAHWSEGWILRSEIERLCGRLDEAEAHAARAESALRALGRKELLAAALLERSFAMELEGPYAESERFCLEASELYGRIGDALGEARADRFLGILLAHRGEWQRGCELMERAAATQERAGDEESWAGSLVMLSSLYCQKAEWTRAWEATLSALSIYTRLGSRLGMANAHNALGEIARGRDDLDEAEHRYRSALAIFDAIGSVNVSVGQLNLGLVLLGRKKFADAERALADAHSGLTRVRWRAAVACAAAGLVACAAFRGDWRAWEEHLHEVEATLREVVDHVLGLDIAWALGLGAEVARDGGRTEAARRAYQLALEHWKALDRSVEVESTEAALRSLDDA